MEKFGLLCPNDQRRSDLLSDGEIEFNFNVESIPFARGKFAAVRRALHKENSTAFAAKYIRKRRRTSPEEVWHEVSVLDLSRDCPYIVHLFKVFETPLDTILLLEMAEGGDLQTVLDAEEYLDEVICIEVLKDTLNGLAFLHQHSIAHLDIKPQNLVVTGALPDGRVKLCDFGVSRHLSSSIEVRELLGTPEYVSPEVLNYEPLTLATDLWSIGVLTYSILSGVSPFGGDCKQETFLNISQRALTFPQNYFESVSSLAVDFIEKLLVIKPSERLTAEGCLRHNWLGSGNINSLTRPIEPNNNHNNNGGRFSPDKEPERERQNLSDRGKSNSTNSTRSQGDPRLNVEHDVKINSNDICHANTKFADTLSERIMNTICN